MKKLLFALSLFCLSSFVIAGGYRVSLQGVRQASLGNTGAMHVKDASVAFYNPAGIAFIDSKYSISVGAFGVLGTAKYQNPATGESVETDNGLATPVYFAASYKPTKDLALGLSVTTPFGSKVVYPSDWSGNNLIREIELRAFFVQPTIAYRFSDWFSMGAGFIYSTGRINLQRATTVGNTDIQLELDDTDAVGLGYNVGFFFKPSDKMNIGLAYRSNIDIEANHGETTWTNLPASLANSAPFFTDEFQAELPLPAEFIAGLSYQATPKLLLAGEVSLTKWSQYKNLDINLIGTQPGTTNETIITTSSGRNYRDRAIWRIGAEYSLNNKLDLRGGYYYDPYPSPADFWSPETPSTSQHAFTGGIGYEFVDGFYVDAYGHYIYGEERSINNVETNLSGDVRTNAFIFGLGLNYNFGKLFSSEEEN